MSLLVKNILGCLALTFSVLSTAKTGRIQRNEHTKCTAGIPRPWPCDLQALAVTVWSLPQNQQSQAALELRERVGLLTDEEAQLPQPPTPTT